jgi:hypothetical protein
MPTLLVPYRLSNVPPGVRPGATSDPSIIEIVRPVLDVAHDIGSENRSPCVGKPRPNRREAVDGQPQHHDR